MASAGPPEIKKVNSFKALAIPDWPVHRSWSEPLRVNSVQLGRTGPPPRSNTPGGLFTQGEVCE